MTFTKNITTIFSLIILAILFTTILSKSKIPPPTPPISPIPTPNPCDYEISFSNVSSIREGSGDLNGEGVPGVTVQVWDSRNGRLLGETLPKKNGKWTMNRIRPLQVGSVLVLTLKHKNNPYNGYPITGTDYKMGEFDCLLTDPTANSLPSYGYIFQQIEVLKKGIKE